MIFEHGVRLIEMEGPAEQPSSNLAKDVKVAGNNIYLFNGYCFCWRDGSLTDVGVGVCVGARVFATRYIGLHAGKNFIPQIEYINLVRRGQ